MFLKDIPILILTFNRPDHLNKCLENLKNQNVKNIFISMDGPRNNFDKRKQDYIFRIINKNKSNFNIKCNHLKKNFGCKNGVKKGIDWFFEKVPQGIILEDDISISNNCLLSFIYLLEKYKNSSSIMSISSHNEFTNLGNKQILLKSPVWRSWGWAGWSRMWFKHRKFSDEISSYSLRSIRNILPGDYANIKNAELLKNCQLKFIDSWAYEFNFSHLALGLSSLTLSGVNCINFGFDENATHTKTNQSDNFENLINYEIENEKVFDMERSIIIQTNNITGFSFKQNKHNYLNFVFMIYLEFFIYLRKFKRNLFNK